MSNVILAQKLSATRDSNFTKNVDSYQTVPLVKTTKKLCAVVFFFKKQQKNKQLIHGLFEFLINKLNDSTQITFKIYKFIESMSAMSKIIETSMIKQIN